MNAAIPDIVQRRWDEETERNRVNGWKSIAQMCASIAINAEIAQPGSAIADMMAAKAKEAHNNMLALLLPKEECHAGA